MADLRFPPLDRPALFDTGAWTWARDRRFPELTAWFNAAVEAGQVLVCDLVILELTRLALNEGRARPRRPTSTSSTTTATTSGSPPLVHFARSGSSRMGRLPEWGKDWGKVTNGFRPISGESDFTNLA